MFSPLKNLRGRHWLEVDADVHDGDIGSSKSNLITNFKVVEN